MDDEIDELAEEYEAVYRDEVDMMDDDDHHHVKGRRIGFAGQRRVGLRP